MLKKLCEAIGDDRPLTTIYGGLVGIALFGPKAVDAFVLPVAIHYWNAWGAALDKTGGLLARCEIQECQQAMLVRFLCVDDYFILHPPNSSVLSVECFGSFPSGCKPWRTSR